MPAHHLTSSITVRNADSVVIGHAHIGGCSRDCRDYRAHLPVHATPRGFATQLSCYHFATFDAAIAALLDAAERDPQGLQRAVDISEQIARSVKLGDCVRLHSGGDVGIVDTFGEEGRTAYIHWQVADTGSWHAVADLTILSAEGA